MKPTRKINDRLTLPRLPALVTPGFLSLVLESEGIAQDDFARRVGRDQKTVSRWINGQSQIPAYVCHFISCPSCFQHFIIDAALVRMES